jgi:cold shock CspA family protein
VKNKHGKDVYFNLDEVRFIGEKDHRQLQEGIEVGYDVGWTSHGLHITKIKIY